MQHVLADLLEPYSFVWAMRTLAFPDTNTSCAHRSVDALAIFDKSTLDAASTETNFALEEKGSLKRAPSSILLLEGYEIEVLEMKQWISSGH